VANTDPEVAWVGLIEYPAKGAGHQGQKGLFMIGKVAHSNCMDVSPLRKWLAKMLLIR